MRALFSTLFFTLAFQSVYANTICNTLDKSLPGLVDIKVEILSLNIVREMTGTIFKISDTQYTILSKNDGSTNFTLSGDLNNKVETCRISVEAGMDGILIEMDLKKGLFVFSDESNIKLTVLKK